jgi:hypothetical protein
MRANWNMSATVSLSEHGKDIYEKYFRDLSKTVGIEIKPPNGEYRPERLKDQLWNLAQIFGSHLYNGCTIPFETMEFELVE